MCRWIFSLVFAAAMVGAAQAQTQFRGVWTLTSGKVRQADGSYVNVAGMQIPYTVEPVGETRKQVEKLLGTSLGPYNPNGSNNDLLTTIYNNDRPANYFAGTGEGPMPSALDDIRISSIGVGTGVLDQMTVGWHIPSRNFVFPVFGFYDNYNPVAPPGTSAFSNVIVDTFGGPWFADPFNFPVVPGEYMITFGTTVSSLGIVFNDEYTYFFQQFRVGNENGPFNSDWFMFFSGGGNPLIGSSDDFFWYDAQPQNGIYAEEEKDLFSLEPGHPFQANFAMRLDIDSNVQFFDLTPDLITITHGSLVSGNTVSMKFNNAQYWVARPDYTTGDYQYPMGVVVTTFAPNSNLISLTFTIDSKLDIQGGEQVVWLWSYTQNQWRKFDTTRLNNVDLTRNFIITQNPSQYVDSNTGEMKAYFQYRENLFDYGDFRVNIDYVRWRIGTL